MITKAIIISKSSSADNQFLVRIPVLESAGNSEVISTSTSEPLYEAALSYVPGNLNAYVPGDIVYVGFEDNRLDSIVILGKLWLGSEEALTNNFQGTSLYINGNTVLEGDVKVNGVTLSTVNKNRQAIDDLVSISGDTQVDIETLKEAIDYINTKKIAFKNWVIEEADNGDTLNVYRVFDRVAITSTVTRDTTIDQCKVNKATVVVKVGPGSSYANAGYNGASFAVKEGIYNVSTITEDTTTGYKWYQIADKNYISDPGDESCVTYYPKEAK